MRTLLVPCLLSLVACSSRGDGRPAPGSDTIAGVVLEVTGEVTARRDAAEAGRPLAVDDALYADDTLTTAADATVKIEIHHNAVVVGLGGGKSVRLCDSVAWKAPRGTGPGLLDNPVSDRTAVAGRPAERAAADTAATARFRVEQDNARKNDNVVKGMVDSKVGDDGAGGGQLDHAVSEREASGPTITAIEISAGVSFAEPVEPMVRAALEERLPACYRALLDAVPGTGGELTLTIELDADGKLVATATSFSPILDNCTQSAVARLVLGPARDVDGKPVAATLVIQISFVPE